MKRVWLLSIILLAVAATEFGLLGAASAGASFLPGWLATSKDTRQIRRDERKPTRTPASPPACRPDREQGGDHACEREPASIQLTPDPLVIECNGYDRSTLTVRVTDSVGRPIADGTYISFYAYNGTAMPSQTQTKHGVASTSVAFYGDVFPPGPNVNVGVGPLEAGVRIRCFPQSDGPRCPPSPPPSSPPCPTSTPPPTNTPSSPPCSISPPSVSPPCATPTPFTPPPCTPWPSPPSVSPPCATPTPWPTLPPWPTPTPCPTMSPSSGPVCGHPDIGSATIAVNAPTGQQAIGVPFEVPVDLATFAPGTSKAWAGYSLLLDYDGTVLQANGTERVICPADAWANVQLTPNILSACVFQTMTVTGTLETITFTCLKAGSSALHLNEVGPTGTSLFDENANFFATTLIDGSITCEASGATPTASAIPVG